MVYFDIVLAIAPIFLLIVIGYGLRHYAFRSHEFWQHINKLVYWVMLPALLFSKISTISLSPGQVLSNAIVIYGGLSSAALFALLMGGVLHLPGPQASSLLQGSARHNSFLALAVADRLFGAPGLSQAALFTALLVPVTNIIVVTFMVILIKGRGQKNVVRSILKDLVQNPLLIAVLLGIGVNLLGIAPIPVINDLTDLLGQGALTLMLIAVGANMYIRSETKIGLPVLFSIVGKMVVFPVVITLLALRVGLSELSSSVAIIYGAVPTGASSYSLARQMGGDADMMSTIITIQTALSFLTLPLTMAIAVRFFMP